MAYGWSPMTPKIGCVVSQAVVSSRQLSGPERTLWELQRRAPHQGMWNQALAVCVMGGKLAVPPLAAALNLVVRRHPALRTSYPASGGEPVAVTLPPDQVALDVPVRGPGHGLWPDELRAAAGLPFDLTRDLPVRVTVLRFRGVDTVVLSLHRIAGDSWTAGLVYKELAAGYGALAAGSPAPAELAGEVGVHAEPPHAGYWRERLAGLDPTRTGLAVGRRDPPHPTYTGALLAHPLGPPARGAVSALARQLRVTECVVLLAAHFALLAYHGGGPDLVVGVQHEPAGGPDRAGYRTGTLPIRMHVDLSGTFADLVTQIQHRLREAVANQPAPPEVALAEPVGAIGSPTQVRHVFRSSRRPAYAWLGDLPIRSVPVHAGHSRYDLSVDVSMEPARTEVCATYRSEIFDEHDVRTLMQRYDALLCRATVAPDRPLAALNWSTSADQAFAPGTHRRGATP